MAGRTVSVIFLFFVSIKRAESSPNTVGTTLENILINVTAGALADRQESNNLQLNLDISVGKEEVLVNDVPVQLSGVTRFNCPALLLDSTNASSEYEGGDLVSTVTRVMVTQNRLYSDLEEVVALQVFSEVIELEGKQVQQPDMCEVKILMSPDFQKVAQMTNIYPIELSEIFRVSRDNDVVVTDPTNRRKEEQMLLQTTSQYPLKHSETTQEEIAAPGKLPETPLRMDPDLMKDLKYQEAEDRDLGQQDQIPIESSPKEFLSYSAVCRWVEDFRERLRHFCAESLPLFFLVMWVVVIGVVGSAVIVKILDLFFPTCEHKRICHLNSVTLLPDDEKHTLLENTELEEEDEMKP
ncbi:glycoprotein integral membrane protein 1 isoform X2 [Phyllopteryx taeniolatus]|uniref:glycoprotein integral membrane protein 1 isoform X2 n=1 Tax=Phyllopteryx taeniolatus TaxID=161469 RepID=UPI002AD54426|nr:glycoprotein integral membrane protein 1 isoform X2 [Phyllopteryx taeniolatus]